MNGAERERMRERILLSGDEVSALMEDASDAGKFKQKDRRQKQ